MTSTRVGYATLQIIPSTKGFGAALGQGVNPTLGTQGKQAGSKFGGAMSTGLLGSMRGLAGPLAAAAGGAALIGGLKQSIGLASDFNETVNKSNVIFRTNAKDMLAWSKGSVTTLGLSQNAALAAASQFGDMFSQMGASSPIAAGMSKDFLKLSGDIGSFQNAQTGDVAHAFQSALRGEYESLKQFLPAVSAARIEQIALNQTGKTSAKQLTVQEKSTALLTLAQKDGANALNDYAETHGALAGQQKELSANIENLKVKIGTAFLPVVAKVTGFINSKVFPAFGKLGPVFSGIGAAMAPVGAAVSNIVSGFQEGTVAGEGLRKGISTLATFFTDTLVPNFKAVVAIITTNAVPIFKTLSLIFTQSVLPAVRAIGTFFVTVFLPTLLSVYRTILTNLVPILSTLAAVFVANILPALQQLYARFSTQVLPVLITVGTIVVKLAGFLLRLAATILGKVIPPLLRFIGPVLGFLLQTIGFVIGTVFRVIGAFISFGATVINIGAKVVGFVSKVITAINGLPGKAISALKGIGTSLLSAGGDLIGGFIAGIRAKAGDIIKATIASIVGGPLGFAIRKLGIHSPSRAFMSLGEQHASAVVQAMNARTSSGMDLPGLRDENGNWRRGRLAAGEHLTLQSSGSIRDDLAEVDFLLRHRAHVGV